MENCREVKRPQRKPNMNWMQTIKEGKIQDQENTNR